MSRSTPTKQPTAPVTVELPADKAAYQDLPTAIDGAILVLHKHGSDPVEVLAGTLDRSRGMISVRTSALSWFGALIPDAKALAGELAKIANGAFSSVVANAPRPVCAGEKSIRTAGWSITSSSGPSVRWCFGTNPDASTDVARLHVVDAARYELLATYGKGLKVSGGNNGTLAILASQQVTKWMSADQTVIAPSGSRTFSVSLQPGTSTRVVTEFDGFSQALVALDVGVQLAMSFAAWPLKWAGKGSVTAEQVISKVEAAQCVPALLDLATDPDDTERTGAVLTACLNAKMLTGVLGAVVGSVVFAALLVIAAVVAFGWTSVSSLVDLAKGDSDYTITIRRAALPKHPGVCDTGKDLVAETVCAFVDAVRAGTIGKLSKEEQAIAKTLTGAHAFPVAGSYTIGKCVFPADITNECPVMFDAGGSRTVFVQPVGGHYDAVAGVYVYPEGVPHRLGVIDVE